MPSNLHEFGHGMWVQATYGLCYFHVLDAILLSFIYMKIKGVAYYHNIIVLLFFHLVILVYLHDGRIGTNGLGNL